tara:strand:- start:890 stop:1150 length:261 start_codon:yes stop_codon:yes gene_type:complete
MKKKRNKIVLEITLESEAAVSEFKSNHNDTMDLCPIEEMTMIAGQLRLPWMCKGIKKVKWKEKSEDRSYEYDVYRLQYDYSDVGQK